MKESLNGVEQTMLLPLWGRYSESVKPDGFIKDEQCIKIVEENGFDFSEIEKQQHPLTRLAWVTRARNTDAELSALIHDEPQATVVCLGCGLDTAFYRCQAQNLYWYDIDLPNVIAIRSQLFAPHPCCRMIEGSILDASTFKSIEAKGRLVFLIMGVLCYLTADDVKTVFAHIARFKKATVVFDYFSAKGVEMSNILVLKNCGGTKMQWSAESEDDIRALHPTLTVKETYPMFQKIMPLLSATDAAMAAQSDALRINSIAVAEIG